MTRRSVVRTFGAVCLALVVMLAAEGCAGSEELEQLSADQRFDKAMRLYTDEDYLEAYDEFRIVTLQFQGSTRSDSAQFLMGECRFKREEYLLAAYEYEVLIRTMPTSKLIPEARYRRALCFYQQSPRYFLDQTATRQAIDEFQSFIEYHPTDSLVTVAEAKITELNTKLAQKEYENGITYMHMEYYKAAAGFFDLVLEKYHDTPFAEQAQLKKAEAMLRRNRIQEAKTEIEKFFAKYPGSPLKRDAEALQRDILSRGDGKSPETGKPPIANDRTKQSGKE
jgi:outer membrane protein assembly factor BamD